MSKVIQAFNPPAENHAPPPAPPAPERTPEVIAGEILATIEVVQATALMGAIKIGAALTEVKEMVPHGEWTIWLRQNVGFSLSTARDYMRVHKEYGDGSKQQLVGVLGYKQALKLIAMPEDDKEFFEDAIKEGAVSPAELMEEIEKFKVRAEDAKANARKLDAELSESGRRVTEYRLEAEAAREKAQQEAARESERAILAIKDEAEQEKAAIRAAADKRILAMEARMSDGGADVLIELFRKEIEYIWAHYTCATEYFPVADEDTAQNMRLRLRADLQDMLSQISEE
jgi:hypothetical protein